MLQYKNIKIVQEVVNEYHYDEKKKKTIHYKKPIVTENILYQLKLILNINILVGLFRPTFAIQL
jgi:hypothetical protein